MKNLSYAELNHMYSRLGMSIEAIAQKLGTSHSTVQRSLQELGIQTRGVGARSGSKNHQWKGGRILDKFGYVLIHYPEHPDSDSQGYIREHRLAMEQSIGRRLEKDELVHHRNEQRDDNRIENLELISKGKHLSFHHTKPKPIDSVLAKWYTVDHMTLVQIAEKSGVHYTTVASRLKKMGIPIRGSNDLRQVNLPDEIAQDYQSMSLRQIAEKHGCSVATVRDSLARLGCQIRGAGKRGGRDNPLGPPEQTSNHAVLGADGQASQ